MAVQAFEGGDAAAPEVAPRAPPPSEEEIREAEAAAAQWGNYVRQLKEQQGKGNKVGPFICLRAAHGACASHAPFALASSSGAL